MNSLAPLKTLLITVLTTLAVSTLAETDPYLNHAIELVRETYQTDRQAFLSEKLQLTDKESTAFWPLYRTYRADLEKIGDELVKLVLEYADLYPEVPDERAGELLKQYMGLEKKLVDKRNSFLKRAGKALPAAKVLRLAQLENRMDLVLRLQLSGTIPVVGDKRQP